MTTYTVNNTEQEQKLYAGREYEIGLTSNTAYNYIYAGNEPVAVYIQNDSNTLYALHTNFNGSIEKISDKNGNVVDSMSYTPFGQRRMFSDWSKTDTATHFIDRGFTGQQHLDNFALINFNGRMYDPVLAHFLSPDPYIQSPENPLNYNRYSYCLFSPLQSVDPSGEIIDWYMDLEGNIKWTDYKDQKEMDKAGIKGKYLGEAVVVVQGSLDERLGKNGTLTGEEANPAKVTIYGINGEDDIETYNGLSVTSDPSKYSMIESGDYKLYYEDMATSPYGSKGGSLSYRIANLDGSLNIPTAGGEINKQHPKQGAFITDAFLHRTNKNGWAGVNEEKGKAVSKACIVIDASPNGKGWEKVEEQLHKSSKIFMRITR